MEEVIPKKEALHKAIISLHKVIEQYNKTLTITQCSGICQTIFYDQHELIRTTRDSMIQRFEYCIDSLWKYLKVHIETVEKIHLEIKSPRNIFKALCAAKILNEQDTELALEMLDARNATSHMYKEEQAEKLAAKIHEYYKLIAAIERKI